MASPGVMSRFIPFPAFSLRFLLRLCLFPHWLFIPLPHLPSVTLNSNVPLGGRSHRTQPITHCLDPVVLFC